MSSSSNPEQHQQVIGITSDYTEDWSEYFDLEADFNASNPVRESCVKPGKSTAGEDVSETETATWSDGSSVASEFAVAVGSDLPRSPGDSQEKFEAQLEGLRSSVTGEFGGVSDTSPLSKWRLLVQAKEQEKADDVVVVRYPKPTALFSLRTDDGLRFLQETQLEKWLCEQLEKEKWPQRPRVNRVARKAKVYSVEWMAAQLQLCLSLFMAKQFGCCLETASRFFRVLGGVSQTMNYSRRAVRAKRASAGAAMPVENPDDWQQMLQDSLMMLELAVRALARACCLQRNGEIKKSRSTTVEDARYTFRGMIENLEAWTRPIEDISLLLIVHEAKGIAHQFASIPGLFSHQSGPDCTWPWVFPPPRSASSHFFSEKSRLLEMIISQLCEVYVRLEREALQCSESTLPSSIALATAADCLCSIQFILCGRSPVTGEPSHILRDALDLLEVEGEAFVKGCPEDVKQILSLAKTEDVSKLGISLASVIAKGVDRKRDEALASLELSCIHSSSRTFRLRRMYTNMDISFEKAKVAFTLALFATEVEQNTEHAEALLFESLFIVDRLPDAERLVRKMSRFYLTVLKAYGERLAMNGKYRYALNAFNSASQGFEMMEKEKDLRLTRRLCNLCETENDWPKSTFYHVELLQATSLDTQLSEFVLISERNAFRLTIFTFPSSPVRTIHSVARICLDHRGDFSQAEAYLRMALSFLQNADPSTAENILLQQRLHCRLGTLLLAANRPADAAHLLSNAPVYSASASTQCVRRQDVLLSLANCALKLRDLPKCREFLDNVLEEIGGNAQGFGIREAVRQVINSHIEAYRFVILSARCCLHSGMFNAAVKVIDLYLRVGKAQEPAYELSCEPLKALTMRQVGRLWYLRGKILQRCYFPASRSQAIGAPSAGVEAPSGWLALEDETTTPAEECATSLWLAIEQFEAVGDVAWQAKVMALIAQVELEQLWRLRFGEVEVAKDLFRAENFSARALSLCADVGYAPLMVQCLINMAEVRLLQQRREGALAFWDEAVVLTDVLYYGDSSMVSPVMKLSASTAQRVLDSLARLLRVACRMKEELPAGRKDTVPLMLDRWAALNDQLCTLLADKPGQEVYMYGRSFEGDDSSEVSGMTRLSMNKYNQGGVEALLRRGCFHRLKMLAFVEGKSGHLEQVKRKSLDVLSRLCSAGKSHSVNDLRFRFTAGLKLFTCGDRLFAYNAGSEEWQTLSLEMNDLGVPPGSFDELLVLNNGLEIASEDQASFALVSKILAGVGVENLVRLLELLLAEEPLIIVCNELCTRHTILSGLMLLLYPFQWQLFALFDLPVSLARSLGFHLASTNAGYVVGMHEDAVDEFIQGLAKAKTEWDEPSIVRFEQKQVSFGSSSIRATGLPAPVARILSRRIQQDKPGEVVSRAIQNLLFWIMRPLLLCDVMSARESDAEIRNQRLFTREIIANEWVSENKSFLKEFSTTRMFRAFVVSHAVAPYEKLGSVLKHRAQIYSSAQHRTLSTWAMVSSGALSTYKKNLVLGRKNAKLRRRWLTLEDTILTWRKRERSKKVKGLVELADGEGASINVFLPDTYIAQNWLNLKENHQRNNFSVRKTSHRSVFHRKKRNNHMGVPKEDMIRLFCKGKDAKDTVVELYFEDQSIACAWADAILGASINPSLFTKLLQFT